jgi:HK97 gp10 family phage protein
MKELEMMEFPDLSDFIAHLEKIQAGIEGAQKDAVEAAAAELLEEVRANLPDDETGNTIRDHLHASIDGDQVTIGVGDALIEVPGRKGLFDVGQAAEDLEFGTVNIPPASYLAGVGFRSGEKIAGQIGADVGRHLAGLPPLSGRK